jgi:hypothetical protein
MAQLSVLWLTAAAVAGCDRDDVVPTEDIPTAGLRFINAVPDTGAAYGLDFRFVDQPESNAHFRIPFRNNATTAGGVTASTLVQYKNARAGQRRFRIFLSDSLQSVTSIVLKDSTLTLEAGKNYTALLWGYARATGADRMRLTIIEESVADPGTNVALRVINATGGAVDVRQYVSTATPPAAATWANVAPFSISAYVTAAPGQKRYNVQPAGGGATLFADGLALPGTPASVDIEAVPGTTVAGSAVTAIVFPRSVAGTRTPQTAAFQVPALSFVWDRRPARACSPLC